MFWIKAIKSILHIHLVSALVSLENQVYSGCGFDVVQGHPEMFKFCNAYGLCIKTSCGNDRVFSQTDCGCVPSVMTSNTDVIPGAHPDQTSSLENSTILDERTRAVASVVIGFVETEADQLLNTLGAEVPGSGATTTSTSTFLTESTTSISTLSTDVLVVSTDFTNNTSQKESSITESLKMQTSQKMTDNSALRSDGDNNSEFEINLSTTSLENTSGKLTNFQMTTDLLVTFSDWNSTTDSSVSFSDWNSTTDSSVSFSDWNSTTDSSVSFSDWNSTTDSSVSFSDWNSTTDSSVSFSDWNSTTDSSVSIYDWNSTTDSSVSFYDWNSTTNSPVSFSDHNSTYSANQLQNFSRFLLKTFSSETLVDQKLTYSNNTDQDKAVAANGSFVCQPEVKITGMNDSEILTGESSVGRVYIGFKGLSNNNGAIYFSGSSLLWIPFYDSITFPSGLTISLEIKENVTHQFPQGIVNNCGNDVFPSVSIILNPILKRILFKAVVISITKSTVDKLEVSVPYEPGERKLVEMDCNGHSLIGRVGDRVAVSPVFTKGDKYDLSSRPRPIFVGRGCPAENTGDYYGDISQASWLQCNLYN
ncbi:hypothetical protein Btru_075689 [Bulinus truncatus]|nr:hypothetical protein Btru_075689 [Bulinus truncatus]